MAVDLNRAIQLSWRRHLLTEAGMAGMLYLREHSPTVQKGGAEAMIFDAGRIEGYRLALDFIGEIIAADQVKEENLDNP